MESETGSSALQYLGYLPALLVVGILVVAVVLVAAHVWKMRE